MTIYLNGRLITSRSWWWLLVPWHCSYLHPRSRGIADGQQSEQQLVRGSLLLQVLQELRRRGGRAEPSGRSLRVLLVAGVLRELIRQVSTGQPGL